MQENDTSAAFKLCVLAEAIRLAKDAYVKTKDGKIAAAALVLTELALDEASAMEFGGEAERND